MKELVDGVRHYQIVEDKLMVVRGPDQLLDVVFSIPLSLLSDDIRTFSFRGEKSRQLVIVNIAFLLAILLFSVRLGLVGLIFAASVVIFYNFFVLRFYRDERLSFQIFYKSGELLLAFSPWNQSRALEFCEVLKRSIRDCRPIQTDATQPFGDTIQYSWSGLFRAGRCAIENSSITTKCSSFLRRSEATYRFDELQSEPVQIRYRRWTFFFGVFVLWMLLTALFVGVMSNGPGIHLLPIVMTTIAVAAFTSFQSSVVEAYAFKLRKGSTGVIFYSLGNRKAICQAFSNTIAEHLRRSEKNKGVTGG